MVVSTRSKRGPMTAESVVNGSSERMASRSSDGALTSHVVASEEVDEGVVTSAFGGVEGRPALEKCGKDGGVFVAKPVENLGKVPLQGAAQSVGDGDAIIDECAPKLYQPSEAAHVGALGLQAR